VAAGRDFRAVHGSTLGAMASAFSTIAKRFSGAFGRTWVARAFAGFGVNDRGATAVEFSLVALPFFALMFAIIETALAFFAQNYFEDTLARVSRQVRTGQAQQAGWTADSFKTKLCSQLTPMFSCPSGVRLDIYKYSTFGDITLTIPTVQSGANKGNLDLTTNPSYVQGSGGDIILVRAYYEWPVFVNRLGNNLGTMPNGKRLLVATAAFRNEPFPW
jgi:Flp pilus assembly protein TadG